MSKLKRNILIFITTLSLIFAASCTVRQQELFFVELGDSKAQTQTLEQARSEWHVDTATPDQHKVLKALADQKAQAEEYYRGVLAAQQQRYYEGIVASRQQSQDCYQAVDKHFSGNKEWFKGIVWRESNNIPSAANTRSTARGCAQLIMSLHSHRFYAVGCTPNDWANADCNIKAADHLYRQAGSSPWNL